MPQVRILLVEDEFLIRLMLAEALADANFLVTEAAGGEEGIRALDQASGFDALVTDVQMPGSANGIDVARHARERFPSMPIIFATARPDSIRGFKERRECDCVIQKPYGPEQMLAALRRALDC